MTITGPPPAFPVTVQACLFDMDGVLTSTARLHAEAWKATFDAFLAFAVSFAAVCSVERAWLGTKPLLGRAPQVRAC